MPLQKLPVVDLDNVNHRRGARERINAILSHQHDDSKILTQQEQLANTPVVNFGYRPGLLKRWCQGDGIADDFEALQAAIDSGLPLDDYGDATYRITQKLIIPAGELVQIRGKVRLRPDLNGSPSLYAFDNAVTQTAGQAQSRFITTSARQGARTIVVNDTADMNVGDKIVIRTETLWPYNNESVIVKGEVNKIVAINTGTDTITLASPLQCEYNTAVDASYVETYLPVSVDIDGLEIDFGTIGTAGGGLGLYGLVDSKIRNVTMRNCGLVGVSIGESYNVEVSNATVTDGYLSGLGYGVQFNGGTLLAVRGGLFRNNRHGVDFSGGIPCHQGVVEGATIIGNTAEGSCVGSHGGGNRLVYRNNLFANSVIGVQARSPNNFVLSNHYHGCASFIVQVGAPGLVASGNQQIVNSIEPVVGINQLADSYFLELGANGDPDDTLFNAAVTTHEMVITHNVCQPQSDFIILQSDVDRLRRLTVAHNTINFQGGAHKLINADAVSGGTTLEGATCVMAPNTVRTAAGAVTILSSVSVTNGSAFVNDATPSVLSPSHGGIFYVTNSSPTTITDFDDGAPGQEITVYVSDNQTTIDFTGTNLRGNGNVDYAPAQAFVLRGKYDGNTWYCTVTTV